MPFIVSFGSHSGGKCVFRAVIILSILRRNAHVHVTPRTDQTKVIRLCIHGVAFPPTLSRKSWKQSSA